MSLSLTFYGVRGSMPCPDKDYMKYGGNTSCLLLESENQKLILDAGTGLRKLSDDLSENEEPLHLLLTHTHGDHIAGLPFFSQVYQKAQKVTFHAGHLMPEYQLKTMLHKLMAPPFFPISPDAFQADIDWHDFTAGHEFHIGDIKIQTTALNHPNNATGYRFSNGKSTICYVTDTEHIPGKPDKNILKLIQDADLVVYDSTYSDEMFDSHIGWGHSTWQEGIRLCQTANVKQLAIFHHNPQHNDDKMDEISVAAQQAWPKCFIAQEGMKVNC